MKGIILKEFADYAEGAFPASPTDGGLTWDANGQYDAATLTALIGGVSAASGIPVAEVLRRFGMHLFARFAALYPVFFLDGRSCLDFLAGLDTTVHGEVRKLHPDAQFPEFACERVDANRLRLVYRSERGLADFAEGLLLGCIAYFGEPIRLERTDPPDGGGHVAEFTLARKALRAAGRRS